MFIYMMLLETEEEKTLFEKLYRKHRQSMYGVAFQILRSEDSAEDAVHTVFLRITGKMEKLKELNADKQKSYLLTAVKHAAFDIQRKRTKHPEVSLDEVSPEVFAAWDITAEEKEIVKAIISLPVIYREVLQYKYVMECENKEIADVLGISESTVRKRLERAKNLLRKNWNYE